VGRINARLNFQNPRDSRSELQLRDVKTLMLTGCDRNYIEQGTHELGVGILWRELSYD
jgi:hypothetical protein